MTKSDPIPQHDVARRQLLQRDRNPDRWRPREPYIEPTLPPAEVAQLEAEFRAEHAEHEDDGPTAEEMAELDRVFGPEDDPDEPEELQQIGEDSNALERRFFIGVGSTASGAPSEPELTNADKLVSKTQETAAAPPITKLPTVAELWSLSLEDGGASALVSGRRVLGAERGEDREDPL